MTRAEPYVPTNLLIIPNRVGTSMKNAEVFVNAVKKHDIRDKEARRV